eukprot:gene191-7906_t
MRWIRPAYDARPRSLLTQEEEEAAAASPRPLDEWQVLGSHNSCHVASLFAAFVPYWRYTHAPLRAQLEMGLRHIELDLWFLRRRGEWVVRHEALIDPLTTPRHSRFADVLRD